VLAVDKETGTIRVQAGIRLHQLQNALRKQGLSMPNLGSIDEQSIAGAISTATHGSSLQHGILSSNILALRIILSNGKAVLCSKDQNEDLFRAALVSLGALGIICEVTFQAVPWFKIQWHQSLATNAEILAKWDKDLWTQSEFVRCWWLPYTERMVVWRAEKTTLPSKQPPKSWYGGLFGFHFYQALLWVSHFVPRILPTVEWYIFGMQYGFGPGRVATAIGEGITELKMDCLFSQYVNEWALPLSKGPEAIERLQAWLTGSPAAAYASGIPFSNKGLYVHSPIEVRVTDSSTSIGSRAYLDPTVPDEPTLYLNATLYRPYHTDPPCRDRYYEAFEWLMKDLGGRPHWAKNFLTVSREDFESMYAASGSSQLENSGVTEKGGEGDLDAWRRMRDEVDPEGMFVQEWHDRNILSEGSRASRRLRGIEDGEKFKGGDSKETVVKVPVIRGASGLSDELASATSEESFDMMHGAEAGESVYLPHDQEEEDGEL
jgi:D-arabinono-1,4-lactone oxidase